MPLFRLRCWTSQSEYYYVGGSWRPTAWSKYLMLPRIRVRSPIAMHLKLPPFGRPSWVCGPDALGLCRSLSRSRATAGQSFLPCSWPWLFHSLSLTCACVLRCFGSAPRRSCLFVPLASWCLASRLASLPLSSTASCVGSARLFYGGGIVKLSARRMTRARASATLQCTSQVARPQRQRQSGLCFVW